MNVETVQVKNSDGDITVINRSDFDSAIHELHVPPVVEVEAEAAPEVEPEPEAQASDELPSQIAQLTGEPIIPDFSAPEVPANKGQFQKRAK